MANQKSAFDSMFGSSSRGSSAVKGNYPPIKNKDELKAKMDSLKSSVRADTPMEWQQRNPKTRGGAKYRYSLFMKAKTFEQYAAAQLQVKNEYENNKHDIQPAVWGDIEDGLRRGFVKIG